MKQDKKNIQGLLSARLRRNRKPPPSSRLRLVGQPGAGDVTLRVNRDTATPEEMAIAAANAMSAATAAADPEFAVQVGALTRMDALCANQGGRVRSAKKRG